MFLPCNYHKTKGNKTLWPKVHFLPDSRLNGQPGWLGRLKIIDSTTVTLFSNLVFRGVGRDPKIGKKKGGIKVHTVISANEGVPGDIKFTSAATHDSFMLKPCDFDDGDVLAMDRAYIDYEKLEVLTRRGVTYVTKTSRRGSKELEVQLLTNSHDLGVDEVIAIYQRRWQIESLFQAT